MVPYVGQTNQHSVSTELWQSSPQGLPHGAQSWTEKGRQIDPGDGAKLFSKLLKSFTVFDKFISLLFFFLSMYAQKQKTTNTKV